MTKDPKEFFEKFAALVAEYDVEIDVREEYAGYAGNVADGVDFHFNGIYNDEHEQERPYTCYELGMHLYADSIVADAEKGKKTTF